MNTRHYFISALLLFSLNAYADLNERVDELIRTLPGRPVMSGKDRPTKLGLLYLMDHIESQGMIDLAATGYVPIVKTDRHSNDRCRWVVDKNPDAIWVMASGEAFDIENETPKQAADRYYERAVLDMSAVPESYRDRVDFIEVTPCMWEPVTVEAANWYVEYLIELLPRMTDMPRPIVLNSGVGGIPTEGHILDAMAPGLRLAHHVGGAWGYHGYSIHYSTDVDNELWYALRYRQPYAHFREHHPEIADLPMILLEGGIDYRGDPDNDGWLARGTLEEFQNWLEWYNGELMKDDYVLGVTLFKIGAPTIWKSFELEPVVPWLLEHYREAYGDAE